MSQPDQTPQNQAPAGREPAIMLPPVILWLLGLMLAVQLARAFVLNQDGELQLTVWFAFIPVRLLTGEFPGGFLPLVWTPVTYAFIHSGWEHLILNCAWLAIFGTPVARRYGMVPTLAIFLVSAIAGAALFAATTLPQVQVLVGASGGIAGLTGAACRFMFQPLIVARHPETGAPLALGRKTATLRELARHGTARIFIGLWLVLNAAVPFLPQVFGADSSISWQAHLAGFLVGLMIVPLFDRQAGRGGEA